MNLKTNFYASSERYSNSSCCVLTSLVIHQQTVGESDTDAAALWPQLLHIERKKQTLNNRFDKIFDFIKQVTALSLFWYELVDFK